MRRLQAISLKKASTTTWIEKIAAWGLLVGAWLTTSGFVWMLPLYFPNDTMAALGAHIEHPDGRRVQYFLPSWNFNTHEGLFYQTAEDPTRAGSVCPAGRVPGTHATYGLPDSGYDWYSVDSDGWFLAFCDENLRIL